MKATGLAERNFLLVCLSHVVGYFGDALLRPVLPLYLVSQGRGEFFVGIVLGTFNLVSFFARPVVGALVDSRGPRTVLRGAGLALGLTPLGYLLPFTPVLFLTRALHGISWGGLNVAGSVWAGALAPTARRAEALGYFTMAQRIGSAVAPALGLWMASEAGFVYVFVLSSLSCACVFAVAHAGKMPALPVRGLGPWRGRVFEGTALYPSLLQALSTATAVPVLTFMPLYFRHLGLSGIELYFLAVGITGIAGRLIVGPWADRMGRMPAVLAGFLLQLGALALFGASQEAGWLIAAGVVYTFGWAWSEPSLYALAIDRVGDERRGVAMATFTASFQAGTGVGSVVGGFVIERLGYEALYEWSFVPAALALGIIALGTRRRQRSARAR